MTLVPDTSILPFYRPLPQGLYTGLVVRLEGFIPQQSEWLNVDFLCGQYVGADISLKFSLRFEGPPLSSSAIVTLNSFVDGQRGEEHKKRSSLRQGRPFTMQFLVTSTGFKITENDRLLAEFPHRILPKRTRYLEMNGDITLDHVVIK